jgi:pSer/pThr/pTyr-binding forkhead associated (FHA) protein
MSGPIVLALRLLLALALYVFLGWTVWTIWQDLRRTGMQVAIHKIPTIRLEARANKRIAFSRTFSQPEIFLGRDPICDVCLDDETVSARHAKLSYHHRQWWLEDLDSTNGTTLNKVKLSTATVLITGDEIRCGKARVKVDVGRDTIAMQPPRSQKKDI